MQTFTLKSTCPRSTVFGGTQSRRLIIVQSAKQTFRESFAKYIDKKRATDKRRLSQLQEIGSKIDSFARNEMKVAYDTVNDVVPIVDELERIRDSAMSLIKKLQELDTDKLFSTDVSFKPEEEDEDEDEDEQSEQA